MRAFLPRPLRIVTESAVAVLLEEADGGLIVAGPIPGVLCNVSKMGACIEIESPLVAGYHLFYETMRDGGRRIMLRGEVPRETPEPFQMSAFSVWMKDADEDRAPGFRIGLRFTEPQPRILRLFQRL